MIDENILRYIENKKEDMLELIQTLVNIDSGTDFKIGVDLVGNIMSSELEKEGFDIEKIKQGEYGDLVVAKKIGKRKGRILLLGHMDTVFPKGTAKKRPFNIQGDRAYGPGVNDMKSGLVSLLYALKSLNAECRRSESGNITVILNSNEEVGSTASRPIIEEEAKKVDVVFVTEPAQPTGAIVTARKGRGGFKLQIAGLKAHAGNNPSDGISAIEELAHKIIELHKLNDFDSGISVNVGVIGGGSRPNIVADHAFADIDLRIKTKEQADEMLEKIHKISVKQFLPGVKILLTGGIIRPPWIKTRGTELLYLLVKERGKLIGLNVNEAFPIPGGAGDANFTAALGVPTIDSMGPVGGFSHSEREYLEIGTVTERCKLLTLSLLQVSRNSLQQV